MPDTSNLGKGGFPLVSGLRAPSPLGCVRQLLYGILAHTVKRCRLQLSLLSPFSPSYSVPDSVCWTSPETPSQTCAEVCLLSCSKPSQIDNKDPPPYIAKTPMSTCYRLSDIPLCRIKTYFCCSVPFGLPYTCTLNLALRQNLFFVQPLCHTIPFPSSQIPSICHSLSLTFLRIRAS